MHTFNTIAEGGRKFPCLFPRKWGKILLVFSKKDGKGFLIFSQKLARSKVGPIGKLEVGGKAPLLSNLRQ